MLDSTDKDLSFLSNDYPCRIYFSSYTYGSVSHALEASKTLDIETRMDIRNCKTAEEARKLGEKLTPYSEWQRIKENQLRSFLAQKFLSNSELKQKLLSIDPEEVILYVNNEEVSKLVLDIKKNLS